MSLPGPWTERTAPAVLLPSSLPRLLSLRAALLGQDLEKGEYILGQVASA